MKKLAEKTILSAKTAAVTGVIKSHDLGLAPGGKITVATLSGGRQEGVLCVTIDAGDMKLAILPTRGMGIWWARYKGKHLFWNSPVAEAVHPSYVNLEANGGLGWLEGFCEGMVRCGMGWHGAPGVDEIIDNTGAVTRIPLPLHGKVANIPASDVTVSAWKHGKQSILSIEGTVYERGVFMDKYRLTSRTDVAIGGNDIAIHDEVTNTSRERTSPLEMLYHINFGGPALGKGSKMVYKGDVCARDERAAEGLEEHASFIGKTKGFTEQCYFFDLAAKPSGATGTMLVGPKGDFAVYELHNKKQMKCFTQWKQMGADEYATGFEPGTDLPNNRGVERQAGRLEFIKPGETRTFDVTIGALATKADITRMKKKLGG